MFVSREKREELSELLRGLLKPSRYEHSLNVASSAVLLAKRYGEDEEKAYLAGLLHDICKNLSYEEQYAYMLREPSLSKELPKELFENRKLWHAPAGAVYIREELKIVDEDIIAAVKYHTTARAGMSLLEKIIYTADFISADRTYEGVDAIRAKAFSDIDEAVLEGTAFSLGKLIGQRKTINRDTLEAYNEGCAKLKKTEGDRHEDRRETEEDCGNFREQEG